MQVRKIDTTKPADRKAFSNLPFTIYRDNKYWVPPFASEMELVLDRNKHPLYEHSNADFFIIESGHEVVGRIAAIHNQNFCSFHHEETGFVYYYEAEDDSEISQMLFSAAFDWARQRGLNTVIGPKGMIRSSAVGLLVKGFECLPAMGILYNKPYYQTQWEQSGLQKLTDYFSGVLNRSSVIPQKIFDMAEKVKKRGNFWIKTFKDRKEIDAWIPKIQAVHEKAFSGNPGYHPSTDSEFRLIAENLIAVHQSGLMKLIMCGDDIAGFVIVNPDLRSALQRTKGKMLPFGWMDILLEMRRTRVGDLTAIGLLPEYQGLGANILIYSEMDKTVRSTHWQLAELIQVDERNFKSKSDMENMGIVFNKIHRLYSRAL